MSAVGRSGAPVAPSPTPDADGDGAPASSFRDPSGFPFRSDGVLYRQVSHAYRDAYDRLTGSGLADALIGNGLLIPHRAVVATLGLSEAAYKVIRPQFDPAKSYPYEWSFSQLKDAALLPLALQARAREHDMSLAETAPIPNTRRTLFLMRRRGAGNSRMAGHDTYTLPSRPLAL